MFCMGHLDFRFVYKQSQPSLCLSEWCCVTSKRLRGIVGRPLTMQCPYPPEHRTNKKFLCKGEHRSTCEVKVTSSGQTDPRLTLQDGGVSSFFSVTITELKVEDEGTYWCGSDYEWSEGNYTKIVLSAGKMKNGESKVNRNVISWRWSQRQSKYDQGRRHWRCKKAKVLLVVVLYNPVL
uniref:Immunoglobulin V-set domain-containing protein n=1 Tax=Echeneis naucrates TaxID=173247 RepID=A0A665UK20_ECHNA